MFKKIILALVVALASVSASLASNIPPLTGHVNDYANILTKEQKLALDKALSDAENNIVNKPQVVLLTVSKLPDEGIDQYANDVFREWKLGQSGVDNGVLLVLAPNDRKVRIEVGYGLESRITDATSGVVIDSMKPFLRSKDYFGALRTATYDLIKLLPTEPIVETKNAVAALNAPKALNNENQTFVSLVIVLGLALVAGFFVFYSFNRKRERSQYKPTLREPPTRSSYKHTSSAPVTGLRTKPTSRDSDSFTDGFIAGSILSSTEHSSPSSSSRRSDSSSSSSSSWSDSSSSSSSSWSDSSSSSSSSDYSGGGGDSGGGGSSDSW